MLLWRTSSPLAWQALFLALHSLQPLSHGNGQKKRLHFNTLESHLEWALPKQCHTCRKTSGVCPVQTDLLAKFRTEELGLPSTFIHNNYVRARRLHSIPFMYCFSPVLVPFPSDWDRRLIDIVGFFFLDSTQSDYKPYPALEAFLAEKDKPVYIGFGSLVVGNVEVRMLPLILPGSHDSAPCTA